MARFIGRTLLRQATGAHSLKDGSSAPRVAVTHQRHRSSQATKLKPQSSKKEKEGEEYDVALKLLDDHIHRILVKKATPDWLPFLPGSSFWVPPAPSASNVATFVHNFTNHLTNQHLQQKQLQKQPLSVSTIRGWPSSQHFFIQENASPHGGDTGLELNSPETMDMSVQVKVLTFPENITLSEDEEG
ncbi:hypothetical protein HN51_064322 [Arachis hypogaea]|uniref:Uncharacterized protein n=1 Tax=Arachis hypogaea TaxID=3818 RepID=A0A445AUV3_ARAHY|nr:uncharacterized protein LOC107642761 [Arachis ipaensis]XP_025630805.1 uncharacterized protein LOC112723597 [Arachis hypogaea]QHO21946.1 uncharacterized protein DS421_11g351000 [Arachis hypogaea]RYR30223.1 hypothetical protein Ahy_B01g055039 isoform A [Arachis hypogaea]RYR30224.1 hypothetical protein Ahy_B01g055039 isoform B [Arachis hypogaea]